MKPWTNKPESEPLDDVFGWRQHDKHCPSHSGNYGHYCNEFDGLWICQDCSEWEVCTCVDKEDAGDISEAMSPEHNPNARWLEDIIVEKCKPPYKPPRYRDEEDEEWR